MYKRQVFTLSGGFCNPALEGFMECQMEVINCPHEQVAGHIADGHTRITRKPAVCLVGPEGFANAVPSMMEAWGERSPVIFITLKRVRDKWKGKLIVKGVMSPEDAVKIKDAGADAIQVSNHGGRQLDSATAAIEALPLIRNVLGKEFPILFDSGIRGGSDIVRALALGANYVMLGRPLMYGIGADGERGLRRVLDIIKDELSTALGLVGLTDVNDITSEVIAKKFIENMKY